MLPKNKTELCTERLTLRPLTTRDLLTTHSYASDAELTKYMMHLPNRSVVDTRDFLLSAEAEWQKPRPSFYEFAVCLRGEHIGAVSLYLNDNSGEIGWILNKSFQNNGYCIEAARRVVDFARSLKLKKLVAHCDTRNAASRRVMEKLEMKYVRAQSRKYPDERGLAEEYLYELEL